MNRDMILKTIADAAVTLRQEFGVKELFIFGSVARGDATAQSDVDILVAFEGPASLDQFLSLADRLEVLLGKRVDLVTWPAAQPKLLKRIEKDLIRAA